MQHLLPDTAFLCDFRQIRRRVDVPLRAVRIDVSDREMQMLSARLSELFLFFIHCLFIILGRTT